VQKSCFSTSFYFSQQKPQGDWFFKEKDVMNIKNVTLCSKRTLGPKPNLVRDVSSWTLH